MTGKKLGEVDGTIVPEGSTQDVADFLAEVQAAVARLEITHIAITTISVDQVERSIKYGERVFTLIGMIEKMKNDVVNNVAPVDDHGA